MTEESGRPTVVVIGGGYGGVNVAKALDEVAATGAGMAQGAALLGVTL